MEDLINYDFANPAIYPYCPECDLGLTYSTSKSQFKLWAPTAEIALLRIYDKEKKLIHEIEMRRSNEGIWDKKIYGNLDKHFYTFQVHINGHWLKEVPDPYAVAVSVNGEMSAIMDMKQLPQNVSLKNEAEAIIIYEAHIRDMTIDEHSGVQFKGKFKGLSEKNTKNPDGLSTGLSHLMELGITHLHLLPCADFKTVDERDYDPTHYNWGYDPQNFNVPEGSYATDPHKPNIRNIEFKELVNTLHSVGIKVIMDVVYNHTYETKLSVFNQLVPGYFYRFWEKGNFSNGSGCDNEVATERPMVRKFIIDSLKHWVINYDIDGFRFDLMALYDLETIHIIEGELKTLKPDILIYGEGWKGGDSPLSDAHSANKHNTIYSGCYASFNDDFRDALKGKLFDVEQKGFISGEGWMEETIKFGITGACYHPQIDYNLVLHSNRPWTRDPSQSINYISCHDNHTLYDKICLANPHISEEDSVAMQVLGLTIVLTSQGTPFLHAGSEILRSKEGHHNSYNLPDDINRIDWLKKSEHENVSAFIASLISLRKKQSIFRLGKANYVQQHLHFLPFQEGNLVAYQIKHPSPHMKEWSEVIVFHNGSNHDIEVDLPPGKWYLGLEQMAVYSAELIPVQNTKKTIKKISTSIFFKP